MNLIGNINSSLGSISWQSVIYQYGHLSFEQLVWMYTACDLALITPIRDGMNLVSKEFIASRKDGKGMLILREMVGAANELTEALLINPNDTHELSAMIKVGLEMPEYGQEQRMRAGSFIEKKEFSVAWHYRNANSQLGSIRAKAASTALETKEITNRLQNCVRRLESTIKATKKPLRHL